MGLKDQIDKLIPAELGVGDKISGAMAKEKCKMYRVKPRENLSILAVRFYGSAQDLVVKRSRLKTIFSVAPASALCLTRSLAFLIEPVSNPKFPANREKNREFCEIRPPNTIFEPNPRVHSRACGKIPYATEQGIFWRYQGKFSR
jgi:hypothetical protein